MENCSQRLDRRETSVRVPTIGRGDADPGAGDDERRRAILKLVLLLGRRLGTLRRGPPDGTAEPGHLIDNGQSRRPADAMIKPSTHLQVAIDCHRDDWP